MASRHLIAQIPFEIMVGNKQTQYFAYVNKDIDSAGRWNIFSQSIFAINHKDSTLHSISVDGQLTYMFNHWLGIAVGGAFDGIRFNPTVGLSLSYINRKGDFVVTAFPTVQLAKPVSLDFFALINYSPQFSYKWGIFSQFILGSNLGLQKAYPGQTREVLNFFTRHNGSTQLLRIGLNYKKKFQFGIGADLAQFGMNEGTFENFGIFLRYQLE